MEQFRAIYNRPPTENQIANNLDPINEEQRLSFLIQDEPYISYLNKK